MPDSNEKAIPKIAPSLITEIRLSDASRDRLSALIKHVEKTGLIFPESVVRVPEPGGAYLRNSFELPIAGLALGIEMRKCLGPEEAEALTRFSRDEIAPAFVLRNLPTDVPQDYLLRGFASLLGHKFASGPDEKKRHTRLLATQG